jgi:predicted ATPase/DNA-binding SARP family transcriptional activator
VSGEDRQVVGWSIRLLGGLRLNYRDRVITAVNTNRMQALLAYLALHTGVLQSREHLAFLFWPDSTEAQARTNLRQLLHHLRSALPDGGQFITADSQNILWHSTGEFAIDVADFEGAVARAGQAAKVGDSVTSRKELEKAAGLYGGDFMPGLYDEWVEAERKRLRQKYSDVLGNLVSLLEQMGEFPSAVQYAERLVELDPLCETSYQTLMHLYGRKGDRAAALLVYHQCVTALRRELDTEPGPATRKLRDELTKQDVVPPGQPNLSAKSGATHLALTGRQREFEQLLEIWKTAEQGRASFALVTGESGIGKTRLLEELLMWASRRGVAAAHARCYAAEGRLAYAPVADWMRGPVLRSVLSRLPASQLSELVRVLPELLVERPELGVPPPLSEGWQRHHFFEALARAVLSGPQPLLLLIDDLQWCDQETMEWLHYLLRLDAKARLLVAGTARIEDLHDRHALRSLIRDLNRDGHATEIQIGRLSSKDTAYLASQVSDRPLDAEFIRELYRETEGNPLFVIESVRAGLLSANEPASQLPPKVHAVLSARLAQLSPRAQDLTSLAACIGRAFTAELLAGACHSDEDALVSLLDELWQRRIIRLEGSESYDFSHDKLREVAYAELSPARRQLYHRRIAESIAKLSEKDADAVSGDLARHYEQAGLLAKAVPLYYQAAKVSRRRYAESEAIGYLRRAFPLLESFPQGTERDQTELDLLVTLGLSLSVTQGYAAAEVGRVYARARMLCESNVGKKDHYFTVIWGSWVYHVVRADLQVAKEMASRLLQTAQHQDDAVMVAGAHFATGSSLFHLGELAQCREHFQQAMAGSDSSDHPLYLTVFGPELGVFCLSYLSHVHWMIGDHDQSAECNRLALARAERLAHPFSAALALDYASVLHQFRGEPSDAAKHAAQCAVVCREYGFSYYLAWTSIIRGWSLAEEGSAPDGVEQIQQGLASLQEQGAALRAPYYQTLLAQAFARAGDIDAALKCLSEALLIREKTGECWSDPLIYELRSTLLRKKGDLRAANASHQRALSVAAQQKKASS